MTGVQEFIAELEATFTASREGAQAGTVTAGTFSSELDALFADTRPMSADERREGDKTYRRAKRAGSAKQRLEQIAVIDFETDPFDGALRERIYPFAACLYSDQFDTVQIWENDYKTFVEKVMAAIQALPGAFTIYAHNGGRFDFMFLISKLRGAVSFKGRGIMCAKIGNHELRDSFHIIPEALAAFKKDPFDYDKMKKTRRQNHKAEIQRYLLNDCVYLFDIVKAFLSSYGMKISIGQAAMHLLKKAYPDCETVSPMTDEFLRGFFYGGRVECLGGAGDFEGPLNLYDVNSMYPAVMATRFHPIGSEYMPRKGEPNSLTAFVDLNCFSHGAFPVKIDGKGTMFPHEYGRYKVSIHEYDMALKYGLVERVRVNYSVDNAKQTKFDRFILPLYQGRIATKDRLAYLRSVGLEGSEDYLTVKKDDIFLKLLQNNAYGKFAQNPRRFKEHYITDFDGVPDDAPETWGDFPTELCSDYAIWSRPLQKLRFNNVGTAASITGGARAVLMEAIHLAKGALYCDTDSLICRQLAGVPIHQSDLGAWDIEAQIDRVLIGGKKLYAYQKTDGRQIIKSKGGRGMTWEGMQTIVAGGEITLHAFAPTLTRTGSQAYIDRRIRATV